MRYAHSDSTELPKKDGILDFIGLGFGPSNLAIAVAARELDTSKTGLFFERNSSLQWHPGMMFDFAKMQISFLKDVVTLRNPASPYTFLQYAKAKGRLERFVNLEDFHPTRLEFKDYFNWVAEAFVNQVQYGSIVRRLTPVTLDGEDQPSVFRVTVQSANTKEVRTYFAQSVIYAPGGVPRIPEGCQYPTPRIVHSSEFLTRFPWCIDESESAQDFGVIGDGQSAGEVVIDLLKRHPAARVHLFISGYAPRPVDNSPFVNEVFFAGETDTFYRSSSSERNGI